MPYHNGLIRAQGDPGFFSGIGGIIGGIARRIPGPIGLVAGAVLGGKGKKAAPPMLPGIRPTPGFIGAAQRFVPGGATGFEVDPATGAICPKRKTRRMNVLNKKALTRANRRQRGFLRAVDATLKTMPTKGGVAKRRKQIAGAVKPRN